MENPECAKSNEATVSLTLFIITINLMVSSAINDKFDES